MSSGEQNDRAKVDMSSIPMILATWFGSGLMRPAPGTWGSLAAIPCGLALFYCSSLIGVLSGIIVVTLVGWWAAHIFERRTGIHDSKMVVIDEVAGQWIALLPALYYHDLNILWVAVSFAAFRFFDITKPWPVSYFDKKVMSAFGVMADDLAAGVYAALLLITLILGADYAGVG